MGSPMEKGYIMTNGNTPKVLASALSTNSYDVNNVNKINLLDHHNVQKVVGFFDEFILMYMIFRFWKPKTFMNTFLSSSNGASISTHDCLSVGRSVCQKKRGW